MTSDYQSIVRRTATLLAGVGLGCGLCLVIQGCGNSQTDYHEVRVEEVDAPTLEIDPQEPISPELEQDSPQQEQAIAVVAPANSGDVEAVKNSEEPKTEATDQPQPIPALAGTKPPVSPTETTQEPTSTTDVAIAMAAKAETANAAGKQVPATGNETGEPAKADQPETSTESKPRPAENVEEQLARMRARMLGLPDPTADTGPPKKIKLLIPVKSFSIDPQHKALRVTFDDIDLLKVLNMEPVPVDAVDHMPKWLSDLNGKRIVLRGWMYPAGRPDGISRFMFVRDSGLCCFGSNPKIYDKLAVTMRDGVTTEYIQGRAFDVIATLRIEPDVLDGELFWLYHLDDALVSDE